MVNLLGEKMILGNQDLQKLLDTIRKKYETELVPITVGSDQLRVLTIRNLDEIIEETAEKEAIGINPSGRVYS